MNDMKDISYFVDIYLVSNSVKERVKNIEIDIENHSLHSYPSRLSSKVLRGNYLCR
jgi:hypothetical protein